MDKLEKKLLKTIANHSIYSYDEIEAGHKIAKSFDVLIEAVESAIRLNITLDRALRSQLWKGIGEFLVASNKCEKARKSIESINDEKLVDDAKRYRWLRHKYGIGFETYLAEGITTENDLDEYIDTKINQER